MKKIDHQKWTYSEIFIVKMPSIQNEPTQNNNKFTKSLLLLLFFQIWHWKIYFEWNFCYSELFEPSRIEIQYFSELNKLFLVLFKKTELFTQMSLFCTTLLFKNLTNDDVCSNCYYMQITFWWCQENCWVAFEYHLQLFLNNKTTKVPWLCSLMLS